MKLGSNNIFKNMLLVVLITAVLISSTGAAHAALSISYAVTGGASSSIVYDPSLDGLLHGNNLAVTGVTGTETQQHAGTYAVTNGSLDFLTGALTSQSQGVWNFGGGGTISMKGGISAIGISDGSTLLNGSFLSATVTELPLGSFKFDIVGATFGDTDNPAIYTYFGLPANTICSNAMSLSFIATSLGATGFTSGNNTIAGQVVDTPTPTPIPAAAWLLGSGLMGLVGIRRRTGK